MKVLHVCETVKGGTATYLNELIPLLAARKDEMQMRLLMPREHVTEVPDIDPASLAFFFRPNRALGLFFLFGSAFLTLLRFRPDIVHAHSTFAGVAARLLGPLFGAKIIYCPHGWAMEREQPDLLRRLYTGIEFGLNKLTTHFVAVSEHERQRGIQAGIPAEKISRIYNGLKTAPFSISPVVWDDKRLKVLFVGRLDKDKGVDILLEASHSLIDKIALRIIGGSVIEEEKITPADYPQATFLGWLNTRSIISHIASCDVVVIPSRWEGFGYVAAEAMRASKPVIAASVGGLKELVKDGETGFLFPREDVELLTGLLKRADRQKLQEMGCAGRKRFLDNFTAERMAKEIIDVYFAALKKSTARTNNALPSCANGKVWALFLLLSLCLPVDSIHAEEPTRIKDRFFYGYGLHLGREKSLAYASAPDVELKLSQLGPNATRDNLSWDIRNANSLQSMPLNMRNITYSLTRIQARPLLILGGDPRAIPEGQPRSVEARRLYADYAHAAATVLKPANPIFEIWNEWNNAARENKKLGTPEDYVALAKVAYPAIKSSMPNGLVLGGAVGDDRNWAWTLKAVRLGLMNYVDGLSVHAYNYCVTPRNGQEIMERLDILHAYLQEISPDKEIPLYLTETGWPDQDGKCGGVSEGTAATNIAQVLLAAPTRPWLKGVWFYELLDQGQDPKEREDHFGAYRFDKTLKPAGCAAKTVWNFMGDATEAAYSKPLPNVAMVVYKAGPGFARIAVWKTRAQTQTKYLFLPKEARPLSLCGAALPKTSALNPVEESPFLIEIPEAALPQLRFE